MVEKNEIKLTEEQILFKRRILEEMKCNQDIINTQITQLEKMLELKLPERQTRNQLNQKKSELSTLEHNIGIIEKQIRTKTEVQLKEQ